MPKAISSILRYGPPVLTVLPFLLSAATAHAELPSVIGVTLGQIPPSYAPCNLDKLPMNTPCYFQKPVGDNNIRSIIPDNAPSFVKDFQIHLAKDNTVDGVEIKTNGFSSQDYAFSTLVTKFGTPTKRVDGSTQNMYGARFNTISAFWVKPDYEVDFVGTTDKLDDGDIAVSTKALHDLVSKQMLSQRPSF